MAEALIQFTERGLYCAAGDFYIDPTRGVDRAVITHAHSDHARGGSRRYLAARTCVPLLRERLGARIAVEAVEFGRPIHVNGVRVSLHPAGHILGSAQVRVEHRGAVWAVSGDYKTEPDATCELFEPVRCHTFITEATFGLPSYCWEPQTKLFGDINDWWRENQRRGRLSVLFGYALGKAQRLLAGVDGSIGPIALHPQARRYARAYELAGMRLPQTTHHSEGALVIAPPMPNDAPWLRKLGDVSIAFASGWMLARGAAQQRGFDRGFALSDHADWNGILATIRATGAESVGVTHGSTATLVRWLRKNGWDAWPVERKQRAQHACDDEAQMMLF
ncbi:MAG TPA: ligase-associated DNA damage response exonuclease [Verrucomicrobiae bacterium]|nr:ligase-associated DNA damage response exonuclease [Verrucomicrobiae bacterium]